jgi:hypothetical protein
MSDKDSSKESDEELGNESSTIGEESSDNVPIEKEPPTLIRRRTNISKGKRRRGNRGSKRKATRADVLQQKAIETDNSETDDNVISPSTSVAIDKVATLAVSKEKKTQLTTKHQY